MSNWREVLTHMVNDAENHYDRLRYRLHYRLGGPDPIKIIPYRGYGSREMLYLKGRVLEDKGDLVSTDNDSLWDNLLEMYRRLESTEVPHARILARFEDREQEVIADEEGFFEVVIHPSHPLPGNQMWQNLELELLEPHSPRQTGPVRATGQVLVPPDTAELAVISDIDDTVIQTDVTRVLRMARNIFLGNASTRLPFPGVAALYKALYHGRDGKRCNPLFYVSSSPWNLYGLLDEFFQINNIPIGPVLFLRDWGTNRQEILPTSHHRFKLEQIVRIMDAYPHLPFILVGDSGQQDPEIYAEVAARDPGRVRAVYIRNVSRDLERPAAVRRLAEKMIESEGTLILADNTLVIAEHAVSKGWIAPEAQPSVEIEKEKDTAPPTPIEKLLGEEAKPEPRVVEVKGPSPERTQSAVEGGAIESAMKEQGEGKQPPSVIVEPPEEDAAENET
jgi:phosphatidate phosphatase APP1